MFWLARKWIVRVFSGTTALNVPVSELWAERSAVAVEMNSPKESKQKSVMFCTPLPSGSTERVTTSCMAGISASKRRAT